MPTHAGLGEVARLRPAAVLEDSVVDVENSVDNVDGSAAQARARPWE